MNTISEKLRERRTQAQRSALTQSKIVNAAASLLQSKGYAATTIQAIAKEAGVSLGALQHHYATKNQLMAVVLKHYAVKRANKYRYAIQQGTTSEERARNVLGVLWTMLSEDPEFLACIEIELARRSDPGLSEATAEVLERIEQFMNRWLFRSIKARNLSIFKYKRQMINIFLRGLAVEFARGVSKEELHLIFQEWCDYMIFPDISPENFESKT